MVFQTICLVFCRRDEAGTRWLNLCSFLPATLPCREVGTVAKQHYRGICYFLYRVCRSKQSQLAKMQPRESQQGWTIGFPSRPGISAVQAVSLSPLVGLGPGSKKVGNLQSEVAMIRVLTPRRCYPKRESPQFLSLWKEKNSDGKQKCCVLKILKILLAKQKYTSKSADGGLIQERMAAYLPCIYWAFALFTRSSG